MRILVIEDEPKIAAAIKEGFERSGYQPILARTGEEGFFLLENEPFDLIILDLQLPGRDGLEILRAVRQRENRVPVIIVTARDTLGDRLRGLDQGADDYLVKPFAVAELLARARAVLRRGGGEPIVRLAVDDLHLDLVKRTASRAGHSIQLTAREFELLEFLMRNHGFNITREMLAREVWKVPFRAGALDNVIDVHIARLRKKIDEGHGARLIHTIRGVGFVVKRLEA